MRNNIYIYRIKGEYIGHTRSLGCLNLEFVNVNFML
jgi:hypothetical protein